MSLADLLVRFSDRKTFARGIHPPGNKALSAGGAIEVLPTPANVVIPLHQHTGTPCEAAVKPRAALNIGDVVGRSKAAVSADVHASIAGSASAVTAVTLPNGRRSLAVPIKAGAPKAEPGAEPAPAPLEGRALFDDLFGGDWSLPATPPEPAAILEAIKSAGLVGQGGAAFPTHIKLTPNPAKPVSAVLLNGCECEPFLTADHRLMIEAPEPIAAGLRLAMRACGASRGVIAIEDNKPDAVDAMRRAAAACPDIDVAVCQTKYPMGGERQLIVAVLGKEVPTGGLPLDVGVVVVNVATSAAIARAVLRGRPLTHRVVTVTGRGIVRPANVLAPIGVAISELLKHCGGLTTDARRVVAGGPMMGFTLADVEAPVTKGTSGITVLTAAEVESAEQTTCVRCGRCVDACPLHLVPTKIAQASKFGDWELARRYDIMACCECGCCAYVCPARVPLAQHIRAGKARIMRDARRK
ncbi:MAG: Electron transport complex subunit RnfC [Phycisphaerae bacterium]|nr:Electron transport complex subunit RnfC [Phycisphaerae bacterium]